MPPQPTQNNNEEIDKALKEFEATSGEREAAHKVQSIITPQAPKVTNINETDGVTFENPTYGAIKFYKEKETPKMVEAVIKYSKGSIKDQRQAEWILFGFVIVALALSIYLLFGEDIKQIVSGNSAPTMTERRVQQKALMHQN